MLPLMASPSDVSDADLRKAVQRLVEQVGSHEMLGVEYVEKMKKQAPRAYRELNGIMGGKLASSEMLKKAFVPDSVDGWLEWEDGTRTAARKEMSPAEIKKKIDEMEDFLAMMERYDPWLRGPIHHQFQATSKQVRDLKKALAKHEGASKAAGKDRRA